jgi:Cu2+-exporting ATPase
MHCANCVARVERLLASQPVEDVRVNLTARTLGFRWRPERVRLSQILAALDDAGFAPRVLAHENALADAAKARRSQVARIGVATICALQVMMLAWPSYFRADVDPGILQLLRWAQLILATPCVLWAGWPFFDSAAQALRARALNMDVPVALALAVAYATSAVRTVAGSGDVYFDTATMFVWFMLIGRFLESRTRAIAGERMRLLAGRRALTAQRCRDGRIETVPIGALVVGDEVVVAPGEALPADGQLLDAAAELDESLLTGESRPVLHRSGEALLAGSLHSGDAPLRMQVARTGGDTTLAQITQLLDRAQTHKPRLQLFADRIAGHFVLAILAFAALGAALALPHGIDRAIEVALAVMVASCPCALSLAVPAALAAATSRLAARGVLVANAQALTRLPQVNTLLVDKTGTLTRPRLSLQRVEVLGPLPSAQCTAIAAALEQGSAHPIAQAFADVAIAGAASELRHVPGAGVSGIVGGRRYWLGAAEHAPVPLAPAAAGADVAAGAGAAVGAEVLADVSAADARYTVVVLTDESQPLARFALTAELRPEAAGTITALKRDGVEVELLTGDSEAATRPLARELGIDRCAVRQRPEDKLQRLRALQENGHVVLAVGDGLNDAPFLAAADVSAALPHGAAVTQARADLLLLGDSLRGLRLARSLARQAKRRMHENFAWALLYNLVVLPLAIAGLLHPWVAAAGMSLSSLLVVANALRLRVPVAELA